MKHKRKDYMEMLETGMSYAEVAKECGVTRQNVYASVKQYSRRCNASEERHRRYIKGIENQVIFVGLADYLIDNDMTVTAFARKCHITPAVMLKLMRGAQELRKCHIDAILEASGLPYEELFRRSA